MGKEKASALCEKRVTRDSRPPPVEHARARGTGNPVLSSPPSSLLSLPPSPPPSLRSPPHLQENSDRRIERVGGGNFIESQPVKSAQGCMEPAGPWGDIADIHKKSSQAGPGLGREVAAADALEAIETLGRDARAIRAHARAR